MNTFAIHSILAGIFISLGAIFSISVAPYGPLVQGLCFSLGLFGVLSTDSNLFTGSILLVEPLFKNIQYKKAYIAELITKWTKIWILNLIGATLMVLFSIVLKIDVASISTAKANLSIDILFVKSILCNILVCFTVWLYRKHTPSPQTALIASLPPVACFVTCGFEHSIADMFYMLLGYSQGAVSILDCVRVIGVATIGNVIGGIIFTFLGRYEK